MKKIAILSLSALIFAACGSGGSSQPAANANRQIANTPSAPSASAPTSRGNAVVSSHSSDTTALSNPNAATNQPAAPSSSMGKPVDVSAATAKIEKADKELKAKPGDAKAQKNLASAYFERAFELTKAAQYRAALGDFRKGLKLNPDDKEAQSMHDQIIEIFASMKREPPKEGEEPAPLPVK
ncbi:MAG TPA: tetratricopeptide repeat protein [Pyrinomonadaceae bacterium]|jgi:tetratricopeptide (TPR) repeat protein